MNSDVEIAALEAPQVVHRRGQPRHQVVDPSVSRVKFAREIEAFRRHEREYRRQGWFLLEAKFPRAILILTAPQLRPAPVLFGTAIDFTNYDVDPPSVVLINPWSEEPLRARELLSPLLRLVEPWPQVGVADAKHNAPPAVAGDAESTPAVANAEAAPNAGPPHEAAPNVRLQPARLMQWWTEDDIPFLCMRGVREYHRHPAHSGDAWLLHRGRGEGGLSAILSAIHDHGVAPIRDYVFDFGLEGKGAGHSAFVQKVTARVAGFLNVLPDGSNHIVRFG